MLFVVFGAISLVGEILGASRHGYPTGSETDEDGRWTTLWRVAAVLAALVTYTALAPSVGHVVMASVSGLIILRVLGGRPWWQTITLAILLGVGSGLLFANLLGLPLPGPGLFVW